jgi:hypothetical protein
MVRMNKLYPGDKCKNGHLLDGDNLSWTIIEGESHIRCLACQRASVDKYQKKEGIKEAISIRNKLRWESDERMRELSRTRKRTEYARNPLKFKERTALGRIKYREWIRKYIQRPEIKIHSNISRSIRSAMKLRKEGRKWESIVGYTVSDLMNHLESKFVEGMSWDNYGKWEIDHIHPKSLFDLSDDESIKNCWRLENLQPLWMSDSRRKHNKLGFIYETNALC